MSDHLELLEMRLQLLERRLRRQQRVGGAVAIVVTIVLGLAALQAQPPVRQRFTELDVERLNVVEPDGQLVLSMANTARLPDPLVAGKTLETSRTGPGLIFFDGKGWEVGGLIYGTRGGNAAGAHFSFDQFHNDQVVYLNYEDNGSTIKRAGLYVVDRARTPTLEDVVRIRGELTTAPAAARPALEAQLTGASAQRIFVGSDNETAMVRLRDRAGRDRIRLLVDAQGSARMEFLDAAGAIVDSLPRR
jgi:catechol 2,3-dioxygenase-like lactoylglutathione lyase family enzyme